MSSRHEKKVCKRDFVKVKFEEAECDGKTVLKLDADSLHEAIKRVKADVPETQPPAELLRLLAAQGIPLSTFNVPQNNMSTQQFLDILRGRVFFFACYNVNATSQTFTTIGQSQNVSQTIFSGGNLLLTVPQAPAGKTYQLQTSNLSGANAVIAAQTSPTQVALSFNSASFNGRVCVFGIAQ